MWAGGLLLTNPLGDNFGQIIGIIMACFGIIVLVIAQLQMGKSWRIGIDPNEKTSLVTHGLFKFVRNPIYSGLIIFISGLLVLLPHPLMLLGAAIGYISIQLQVRYVEEPQMIKYHGIAFKTYGRRVGRYLPYIGKIYSHSNK